MECGGKRSATPLFLALLQSPKPDPKRCRASLAAALDSEFRASCRLRHWHSLDSQRLHARPIPWLSRFEIWSLAFFWRLELGIWSFLLPFPLKLERSSLGLPPGAWRGRPRSAPSR